MAVFVDAPGDGRGGHRVGILLQGQLVATGTVDELRDTVAGDENLESIFLRITGGETSDQEVAIALDLL